MARHVFLLFMACHVFLYSVLYAPRVVLRRAWRCGSAGTSVLRERGRSHQYCGDHESGDSELHMHLHYLPGTQIGSAIGRCLNTSSEKATAHRSVKIFVPAISCRIAQVQTVSAAQSFQLHLTDECGEKNTFAAQQFPKGQLIAETPGRLLVEFGSSLWRISFPLNQVVI